MINNSFKYRNRLFFCFVFVFLFTLTVFCFPLTTVKAEGNPCDNLQDGSTCQYGQGDQVCTGSCQNGTCKYDAKLGPNCQKSGTADQVFGFVSVPAPLARIGVGAKGLSTFLSNVYGLVYALAAIVFLFMIIWAAFQWILAGGDKEAVSKARQRIFNAVIGILLLALAGVFFTLFGKITGFKFFK